METEFDEMTKAELIAEIMKWRTLIPQIKSISEELKLFRQMAASPEDLAMILSALQTENDYLIDMIEECRDRSTPPGKKKKQTKVIH